MKKFILTCAACLIGAAAFAQEPVTFTAEQDHQNMLDQLGIKSIRRGFDADQSSPYAANYDESKANPYPVIPDLMTTKDGKKVKNAKQISVSCTISKNITASTGDKIVYVRIMQPDGEPLTKGYSNTFKYQNRDISYSMNKSFEFSGEEHSLTLYWNIEETLQQGRYRAYIFVDGNMIGEGYADFE